MHRQNTKVWLTAGLVIAAASFPVAGQAKSPGREVRFCAPTATVCDTLVPGVLPGGGQATSVVRRIRFCAPTATVCDTLVPGVLPGGAAGTGRAAGSS